MNSIVLLLVEILKQDFPSYEFVTANDGAEACKLAVKHSPVLILMDWEMPHMNGEAALIRLKGHKATSHIPIIILSAGASDERLRSALNNGAIDFIKKPIDDIELIARVQSALKLTDAISKLHEERDLLEIANQQNISILNAILPAQILDKIQRFGSMPPKNYKNCAVIFIDLVDFTEKSSQMSPARLLRELNDLFTNFDAIMQQYQCTRIKTIGDAYLAVCGLFDEDIDVSECSLNAAIEIRECVKQRNELNQIKWELRIGIYHGDVIGSAVSTSNLSFDVFGETVNMASRFEYMCDPMQINVSETIFNNLRDRYKFVARTSRLVKGKGVTPMYYYHKLLVNKEKQESESLEAQITLPMFS